MLLWRIAAAFARYCAYAGVMLLIAVTLMTVADILTRRSINVSILGLIDLTQLLVMSCVFLIAPFVFLYEGNVGVEFVTDRLPPKLLAQVKALAALAASVFMFATTYYSWKQAAQQIEAGDQSQTIGIPFGYYWAPLLFGCAASALAALVLAYRFELIALGRGDIAAGDKLDTLSEQK